MDSNDGEGAERQADAALAVSCFDSCTDSSPKPDRVNPTEYFAAFYPAIEGEKETIPCWSPATFANGRRLSANVTALSALVLDYDGDFDLRDILNT